VIGRILTSNWVAIPLLVVAGISLVLLFLKGRTKEALIGGAVLALAAYLILRRGRDDDQGPDDGP
jgi:membrane protein implicated in regulation of membrane protease activity